MTRAPVLPSSWHRNTAALLIGLLLPLAGCSQERPATNAVAPTGIKRDARPQVIIRHSDVFIDGRHIQIGKTTAAEVSALTGRDASTQQGIDEFGDATGIYIMSNPSGSTAGKPNLVHSIMVWLRQVDDFTPNKRLRSRPCTPEAQRQHDESVKERLRSIATSEKQYGIRGTEKRDAILKEKCSLPAQRPENPFTGYLEVDGVPVGPNTTLGEVQARRKQLGLLPLRELKIAGPRFYLAPRSPADLGGSQQWEFMWDETGMKHVEDMKIKVITLP